MPVQLASGVLLVLMAAAQLTFAIQVGGSYADDSPSLLGLDEGDRSVLQALPGATLAGLFGSLTLGMVSYVYCQAITAEDPTKWDKQPEEPDAMGEIIKSGAR